MQATTFPVNLPIAGAQTDMADEKPPEAKTWITELSRWIQVIVILATMLGIGLPIEHRLTSLETKADTANNTSAEAAKAQRESNGLSLLSLQTSQTVLEILVKMRLPKEDRKKVEDKLAEIKAKKISQAGDFAGGGVGLQEGR